jgi:hypothetical protein
MDIKEVGEAKTKRDIMKEKIICYKNQKQHDSSVIVKAVATSSKRSILMDDYSKNETQNQLNS